jgi:aminoglycoside 2''-phosphotransferase|tara:strand:+ start:1580 stop:2371 length:792 start_codon:yes stop_codon:yes gene_type:complete
MLDNKYIFRFPKDEYRERFKSEVKLLKYLQSRITLQIPNYTYVAGDKSFGGYKIIAGREMRAYLFHKLPAGRKKYIAKQVGQFLTQMHATPISVVRKAGIKDEHTGGYWWSRDNCLELIRKMRRKVFPKLNKEEIKWIEKKYNERLQLSIKVKLVALQNDFGSEHILFDYRKGKVTGVIDFADIEVGDPASDFALLWVYGKTFIDDVLKNYNHPVDEDFLKRSKFSEIIMPANDLLDTLEGIELSWTFDEYRERLHKHMKKFP